MRGPSRATDCTDGWQNRKAWGVKRSGIAKRETDKPCKKPDLWNAPMEPAVTIYRVTNSFPWEDRHGFADKIKRAVSRLPANVAEGAGRQTRREFINYLHLAQGSLSELDTHLELAQRLGYIARDTWVTIDRQIESIDKYSWDSSATKSLQEPDSPTMTSALFALRLTLHPLRSRRLLHEI